MEILKIHLITEGEGENSFSNKTEDQFPYIESTINTLDDNFNWWKKNWESLEQLISQNLKEIGETNSTITSRFTIFHGKDDSVKDVVWTGPAIVYTIQGISPEKVEELKKEFGGMYHGKKIFALY